MHVQLRRSHLPHAGGECFGRRLLDVWRFGGIVWSDALSLGCGLDVPLDKSFWCARTNTGPDHPNAAFGDPSVPFPLQKTQTRTVGFQMRKVDTHARDARDTRVAFFLSRVSGPQALERRCASSQRATTWPKTQNMTNSYSSSSSSQTERRSRHQLI